MRSKLLIRGWCFGFLCALTLNGCTVHPLSPTSEPNKADLVGTWTPDAATIKLMREDGGYDLRNHNTKIVLNEDSSVQMVDIPDWWFFTPFTGSHRTFKSASGTWRVSKDSEWGWSVDLSLSDGGTLINLNGRRPPYQIYLIIGDPDRGTYMFFDRIQH